MIHGTDSTAVISAVAIVVAFVGGVRSTWSPCGISMLSTITPLAEKGRGHRWWATATWYLAGSVAGGATLGAVIGLLAAGVHGLAPTVTTTTIVIAAAITLLAAAAETGSIVPLPIHHRQVNERWLDAYRPWVYATGFGWQIGTGVATYIKTSAVYVLIALAALTGNPLLALGVGILFGLVRGLAVYASRADHQHDRLGGVPPTVHGARPPRQSDRGRRRTRGRHRPGLARLTVAGRRCHPRRSRHRRRRRHTPVVRPRPSSQTQRQAPVEPVALATSPGGSRTARTA